MKVESITLKNIGQFKDLTIPLAPLEEGKPKVTVFIGNNGSGKTSILKSLVTALSWIPARIRSERGRGLEIPEEVIMNGESSGLVSVNALVNSKEYTWVLSKSQKGKKNQFETELKTISLLADIYRSDLTENQQTDLPILVFYPVERSVLDIPLKIREKHQFEQLNGYDNAMDMGVDFRRFFEWFREREDIENEEILFLEIDQSSFEIDEMNSCIDDGFRIQEKLEKIEKKITDAKENGNVQDIFKFSLELIQLLHEFKRIEQKMNALMEKDHQEKIIYSDIQLKAVKEAIQFFTNFEDIRVQRKPRLRMVVKKDNLTFEVAQLSQGEKSLMALVGDIARRLAMLNPSLKNPLEGQGVVIIDEADLHLHPQWQRQLIARLTKTFPNCQFVLSTHSPLVISDSKDIVVYSLENGEMTRVPSQYGQDANTVLLNVMETPERNQLITEKINHLLILIQENQLDEARQKLTELHEELPENILELSKAALLIKKQELRNEIHQKKS